jgi:putative copper export protein
MPKQVVFAIVTFLHDLFTAVWVGGLIALGVTVLPSAKQVLGTGPQTKKLMDVIQKRLSLLVYISIVGLALTGLLLSGRSPAFQGLFCFGNTYSTVLAFKHLLVLAMVAVALYRSLVLGRQRGPSTPSREKLSAGLLFLNIALGIVVLLLSGFGAALSSGSSPG